MTKDGLIAHVLIKKDDKLLVIKRSKIKRGEPNYYPEYWDIPGGTVENGELPRAAAKREVFEETGQHVKILTIIHEDSNYDSQKDKVFTRLVYSGEIIEESPIVLDPEEHTEYKLVDDLSTVAPVVDYLQEIISKKADE